MKWFDLSLCIKDERKGVGLLRGVQRLTPGLTPKLMVRIGSVLGLTIVVSLWVLVFLKY